MFGIIYQEWQVLLVLPVSRFPPIYSLGPVTAQFSRLSPSNGAMTQWPSPSNTVWSSNMPLVLSSAIAPHSVFITALHIVSTEELCTSAIESYLTPCTHTQPSVSHRDVILKFIITSKFEQTVTKAKKEQLRRARNKKLDEPTTGILMTRCLQVLLVSPFSHHVCSAPFTRILHRAQVLSHTPLIDPVFVWQIATYRSSEYL
jgi:hypothetical protein